jgi:hypothetical protein
MMKSHRWLASASVVAAALLAFGTLGGSAEAATRAALPTKVAPATAVPLSGGAVQPQDLAPGYFLLYNTGAGQCLQEQGTTTPVYGGDCPYTQHENSLVNHSLAWSATSIDVNTYYFKNEHSGLCLTASLPDNVALASCNPGTVQQEWKEFLWVNSSGTFLGYGFQSATDGQYLAEDPTTGDAVTVQSTSPDAYSWGNWFVEDLS